MAGTASDPVESIKIPGASGWEASKEMTEETSSGTPCVSRIGRKLLGVSGLAGKGRERDWRELAMRMRLNRVERGGERSWERMALPTPPRPMRATGIGRTDML